LRYLRENPSEFSIEHYNAREFTAKKGFFEIRESARKKYSARGLSAV
jgi:hypothetical protein